MLTKDHRASAVSFLSDLSCIQIYSFLVCRYQLPRISASFSSSFGFDRKLLVLSAE